MRDLTEELINDIEEANSLITSLSELEKPKIEAVFEVVARAIYIALKVTVIHQDIKRLVGDIFDTPLEIKPTLLLDSHENYINSKK